MPRNPIALEIVSYVLGGLLCMCHKALTVEFLYTPGCGCAEPALRVLRQVLADEHCETPLVVRLIADEEEALRYRFHGSPTIRIDGVDIEGPSVERQPYSLRCRVYDPYGECSGVPEAEGIRAALYTHPAKRGPRRDVGGRPR